MKEVFLMKPFKLIRPKAFLSIAWIATFLLSLFSWESLSLPTEALSTDYPVPLMQIATKDNSTVLTENGTSDHSSVSVKTVGNDLSTA